jgi:hypothetical protein
MQHVSGLPDCASPEKSADGAREDALGRRIIRNSLDFSSKREYKAMKLASATDEFIPPR